MTATTTERNTPRRDAAQLELPVAASARLLAGTIAMINASGLAEAGTTATARRGVGVVEATADNTGGAASAISVRIRRGCFAFANSTAGDAITRGDIGATAYIVDNQTVAKTDGTGTRSPAGVIRDVDGRGVWVQF
jgi:hypothetical protein